MNREARVGLAVLVLTAVGLLGFAAGNKHGKIRGCEITMNSMVIMLTGSAIPAERADELHDACIKIETDNEQ